MSANVVPLNRESEGEDLETHARRLAMRFSASEPQEILRYALKEEFAGQIALVSSFGAESAILLHMVSQIDPDTPIVFLETGKHFAQTLSYRKKLAEQLKLTNVRDIKPTKDAVEERDPQGDLWRRDPDACCTLRKVEPLGDALSEFDAWITGRKQFHGGSRVNLPAFEANDTHIKVNPLVRWTKEELDAYMEEHDLPSHPLSSEGYPSIGCWPCTHPVANEDDDVRAGRWRGSAKTECGIHSG
ncbi:MAG: phosphoadenylyl-sulfate reductase [Pseudomonadota bacterium]